MAEIPKDPCSTCPYVRATPPGVWDPEEYERLRAYDEPTGDQPMGSFGCHYDNGNLCGGWLAAHDIYELLAIRLAVSMGFVDPAVYDYETDVPCWGSGNEAADRGIVHGEPSDEAKAAISRIEILKIRAAAQRVGEKKS